MFILDTNVLSELRRSRPHGAVLAWLEVQPARSLFFASVSAGEIQAGIEMTRKQDPFRASEIQAWLDAITGTYQCIDANAAVFREWARLMHGRQDKMIEDCLIAATARVYGMTVATRNVRHFLHLDVPIINPFDYNS